MWKKWAKEYFSFSKKERTGIVVMLFIILLAWIIPFFYSASPARLKPEELSEMNKEAEKFRKISRSDSIGGHENMAYPVKDFPTGNFGDKKNVVLFDFDPNTLTEKDWRILGLREKTIATIRNFILRGGKFRSPKDLAKIYGLRKVEFERISPYVRIPIASEYEKQTHTYERYESKRRDSIKRNHNSNNPIDVNSADTSAFIALSGIGATLAGRIVLFREKLGGFYSIEQVGETFGLKDSVFQKIKPLLSIKPNYKPVLININTVDAKTLSTHPYIRYVLANAIVQFRSQHGDFQSVDELSKIAVITPEIMLKIKPYLTIN